jgi:predicted nucleic acid-binding protein
MPRTLVVDATPLLSALIGGSALPVLFDSRFRFITTEKTTWEVKRYIPHVVARLRQAGKTAWTEARLEQLFHHLPIAAFGDEFYGASLSEAHHLIDHRDPEDADLLALALQTNLALWTEDHDFDQIARVRVVRTSELVGER